MFITSSSLQRRGGSGADEHLVTSVVYSYNGIVCSHEGSEALIMTQHRLIENPTLSERSPSCVIPFSQLVQNLFIIVSTVSLTLS